MKAIAAVILSIVLCGCASVGRQFDMKAAEQIKAGDSKESVIAALGKPMAVTKDTQTGSEIWSYIYSVAHSTGPFTAKASARGVTIYFDRSGMVSNVQTSVTNTQ